MLFWLVVFGLMLVWLIVCCTSNFLCFAFVVGVVGFSFDSSLFGLV